MLYSHRSRQRSAFNLVWCWHISFASTGSTFIHACQLRVFWLVGSLRCARFGHSQVVHNKFVLVTLAPLPPITQSSTSKEPIELIGAGTFVGIVATKKTMGPCNPLLHVEWEGEEWIGAGKVLKRNVDSRSLALEHLYRPSWSFSWQKVYAPAAERYPHTISSLIKKWSALSNLPTPVFYNH